MNQDNPILIFDFFSKLKKQDPRVYVIILCCIFLQILFTFIKLEATPFFLFGMFSEKVLRSDTFTTVEVLINDRSLDAYQPSLRERQLLNTTAGNYIGMKRNNQTDILQTRIENRYPFITNADFYPFVARHIYNGPRAQNDFKTWLKAKCYKIAGIDNGVVRIVETQYLLNSTTLYPTLVKHETLETF